MKEISKARTGRLRHWSRWVPEIPSLILGGAVTLAVLWFTMPGTSVKQAEILSSTNGSLTIDLDPPTSIDPVEAGVP